MNEQDRMELHEAEAYQRTKSLLGTSAEDCWQSVRRDVERNPGVALCDLAATLTIMNNRGIEKASHRMAIKRAAREAINILAELPA